MRAHILGRTSAGSRGNLASNSGSDHHSALIPELIATGWLADVPGTERSLHPGPRWEAAGASWLEHQSTVPNVPAYYFQHGPGVRPSAKEPFDA